MRITSSFDREFLTAMLVIVILLCAGPLLAQTPQTVYEETASISGNVLDSSGKPVEKALLTLRSSRSQGAVRTARVETLTDGSFSFSGLASGNYVIESVDHPAYATRSFTTQFSLSAGQEVKGVAIVLQTKSVLSGRLSDNDGEPVEGIPVVAFSVSYAEGRRKLSVAESDVTDDRGFFRLANLESGRYYLAADRYPPQTWGSLLNGIQPVPVDSVETLFVTTFYPNVQELSGAEPFDLAPGEEILNIDFAMLQQPVYSIEGVVVDRSSGAAVPNARVIRLALNSQPSSEIERPRTITDNSGAFRINNLPRGEYTLFGIVGTARIVSPGWDYGAGNGISDPRELSIGQVSVTLTGHLTGAIVEIGRGRELTGRVLIDDGSEEGAELTNLLDLSTDRGPFRRQGLRIRLQPMEGAVVGLELAEFEADGYFTLRAGNPGEYIVSIEGLPVDSGLYVHSIQYGKQDGTSGPLLLGSASEPLNIILRYGAAALRVHALDNSGSGVAGAYVSLWRVNPNSALAYGNTYVSNTDQNSLAEHSGLTPGEYYVAAWEELPDPGLALHPEFLRLFEELVTKVDISSASIPEITVDVVSRDQVAEAFAKLR